MVLDELRLIEDEHVPVERLVLFELETQQRVRRHDDARVTDCRCEVRAAAGQGLSDGLHADAGRELLGLVPPVLHHARGSDNEKPGVRFLVEDVQEQRKRLDRLAEAHVVGKDSAEAVASQEREPVEPVALDTAAAWLPEWPAGPRARVR